MRSKARSTMADHDRRNFLTRAGAFSGLLALGGCSDWNQSAWWPNVLGSVEALTKWAQRLFAGSHALAQEYTKADIAPTFRANGSLNPGTAEYEKLAANDFRDWRLEIAGLVSHPLSLSLADLMRMP